MAFRGIDWTHSNVKAERAGHACETSELLKALAHEGLLTILRDLLHGEKSVGELEALLSKRQASVSQQLARPPARRPCVHSRGRQNDLPRHRK